VSEFRWAAVSRARLMITAVVVVIAVASAVIATAVAAAPTLPRNTLAPEVVGGSAVGELLSCGAGSWENVSSTPAHSSPFSYQWDRNGIPIPSASGDTYRATAEDRGGLISCVVTAYNYNSETKEEVSEYEESSNSIRIEGEQTSGPVNKELPVVSGTPAVGQVLSCSTGAWGGSPAPTYTFQWLRNGNTLGSKATGSGYEVTAEDEGQALSCAVTASNSAGKATATSASVQVHTSKPENVEAPKVLGGTAGSAVVGESLTCTQGTWTGAPPPSYSYQWLRDGTVSIGGATASSYTLIAADEGHVVSCRVTATNSKGEASTPSSNGISVGGSAPVNTAPPVASPEAPSVGETAHCSTGTWTGSPELKYQWSRDETALGVPSTTSTHVVSSEDHGHALYCIVYAYNAAAPGGVAQSSLPIMVEASGSNRPVSTIAPFISGVAKAGQVLTCSEGEWNNAPALYSYQWLRDGTVVASATKEGTRTVLPGDVGHSLSCTVTAYNSGGKASRASSNSVTVAGAPPKNLEPPFVLGPGAPAVNETLTCSPGRWEGAPPPTYTFRWFRDGAAITLSSEARTYTVVEEDRGHSLSCQVVATNSLEKVTMPSANQLKVPGVKPLNLEAPVLSGTPEPGQLLTCTAGKWDAKPAATYTYQWLLDGQPNGARSAETSHTVAISERGRTIACAVTAMNSEGEATAVSSGLHIPGVRPKDEEPPKVSGSPTIGAPLTCTRGIWSGRPAPVFTYQWQSDGANIPGATGSTYTVAPGDQGHLLTCNVTATNSEGSVEAESGNSLAVPAAQAKTEVKTEMTFVAPVNQAPPLTAQQVLSAIAGQLAHAQNAARIGSILRTGSFGFSFRAPTAGTLNLFWFEVPKGAHVAARSRPILVLWGTTSFPSAGKRIMRLHLTVRGRELLHHGKHVKLTAKAVFVRAGHSPVTWLKTFLLNR
jgi:hypothetical protein